jgi:hypothetical protein
MVFDRADETRYVFRLTHEHPGDESYKGCSGAPICDADGTLVSVVLGGDPPMREIYGAPLARYRLTRRGRAPSWTVAVSAWILAVCPIRFRHPRPNPPRSTCASRN